MKFSTRSGIWRDELIFRCRVWLVMHWGERRGLGQGSGQRADKQLCRGGCQDRESARGCPVSCTGRALRRHIPCLAGALARGRCPCTTAVSLGSPPCRAHRRRAARCAWGRRRQPSCPARPCSWQGRGKARGRIRPLAPPSLLRRLRNLSTAGAKLQLPTAVPQEALLCAAGRSPLRGEDPVEKRLPPA